MSLLSVWETHLQDHAPCLSCHVYHGPKKNPTTIFLRGQDVVLTTYATAVAWQKPLKMERKSDKQIIKKHISNNIRILLEKLPKSAENDLPEGAEK
jgi:hypothetical protein